MKKYHLIDSQKYKNYYDNFLHNIFNIMNRLIIKKLYIYHHSFYII